MRPLERVSRLRVSSEDEIQSGPKAPQPRLWALRPLRVLHAAETVLMRRKGGPSGSKVAQNGAPFCLVVLLKTP